MNQLQRQALYLHACLPRGATVKAGRAPSNVGPKEEACGGALIAIERNCQEATLLAEAGPAKQTRIAEFRHHGEHRCDIIETGNDSYRLKKRNQSAPGNRKSKEKNLTPNP